jgi:hypothetical protein
MKGLKPIITAGFCAWALSSGYGRHLDQYEAEAKAIFGIMRMLAHYDLEHPNARPTNLSQLFLVSEQDYPYEWGRQFRTYGNNAGFTNSIYEKYVFFPPGITNRRVTGEIVLMNAHPYPANNGELQRTIVSKSAEGYHREPIGEDLIQTLFKEAGVVVPKPPLAPRPPLAPPQIELKEPLFSRIRGRFLEFLQLNGISGSAAAATWYIVLSLPFVMLFGFALWSRRHKRN